jgi:hypothetical protein
MGVSPTAERPLIRRRADRSVRVRRRRERQEFGGRIQWEAVFFGLLAGVGLALLLVAMVIGGLLAAGVTSFGEDAAGLFDHLTVAGGAIVVAILALGYLTGGYVAARMARFDGWRQGLGIWLLSLLIVLAAAVTAWIAGGELDPTKSISLPDNPIDEGPMSYSVAAAVAILVLVPLVAAVVGGVLGERFHRAVDSVGIDVQEREEPEQPPEAEDVPEQDEEVPEQDPPEERDQEPGTEAMTEADRGPETETESERAERDTSIWR